jgi:nucleotide-binding universal stress UspA family protein
MQRIVVGVDGSENSRVALDWALAEAQLRHASVDVVNAWQPVFIVGFGGMPGGAAVQEDAAHEEEAHRVLDEMTAGTHPTDPAVTIDKVAVRGLSASALLEAAKGADLLVVGSRGRGGFAGLLLGSVSQQVAQHAECPVVIVPSP